MNFLSITALFFLASSLAADNRSNSSSRAVYRLDSFLENYDTFKETSDDVVSFGYALVSQDDLVRYDRGSARVFVSTGRLTEIIAAEYDLTTGKRNPFHVFCSVDALLKELQSSNYEVSLFQFRRLMSRCASNRTVMVSVDIAILKWLVNASIKDISIKIRPSLLQSICLLELHAEYPAEFSSNILRILSHVHCMIKANTLSREELIKYAYVFARLVNVLKDGQVLYRVLEISDTILAMAAQNV